MKKFLSAALIVFVFTLSANICAANYYDDDPNYFYVITAHQGSYYLNLRSIDVQEYNPPHYQIAGTFVHVSGMYNNLGEATMLYVTERFNWYTKESYNRDKNGNWRKTVIEPDCTATKVNRKFADALFRAAYGMDFYGY